MPDGRTNDNEGQVMTDSGAQVKVTARELLDRGAWIRACEMTGLNEWAVNEGRMDDSETVTLTLAQAVELGLDRPWTPEPDTAAEARDVAGMCRSGYARHTESAAALGLTPAAAPAPVSETADGAAFTIIRDGRAYTVTVTPAAEEV